MLSTRLTGSSTSITSASIRNPRSTGRSAPGRAKCSAAKASDGSSASAHSGSTSAAISAWRRSKNAPAYVSSPSPGASSSGGYQ
jgi:hypothetical protein